MSTEIHPERPQPTDLILVEGLTFEYPGTRALEDVTFRIKAGTITALVGPNGAGKSTLLRCLAALAEPLVGRIVIDGNDVLAHPRVCHRQIGYLSDFFGLYDELTARQCLLHAAAIRGLSRSRQKAAANNAAERLGLTHRLDTQAGRLSRGFRQRLAIAQSIVHEPRVLLLDEPAAGLDPEARHDLAELLVRLRDESMTLVVSSHILAELDAYSTEMLVLQSGRIAAHVPVHRDATMAPVPFVLDLSCPAPSVVELLARHEGVSGVEADGATVHFTLPPDPELQHELLKALLDSGAPVCSFGRELRSMQDAYLTIVAPRPAAKAAKSAAAGGKI